MQKTAPFDWEDIQRLKQDYPTPFYAYDEKGILETIERMQKAFEGVKGFKNYYAVKALPNPHILKLLLDNGMGLDCSSPTELMLAEKVGARGDDVMFTSNNTTDEEFRMAKDINAIINLDDISHFNTLVKSDEKPELLCFRYNPGEKVEGNEIIGEPQDAKFGMTHKQILDAVEVAKAWGVKQFGLHAMAVSNNLDINAAMKIVTALVEMAVDVKDQDGIEFEFINLGGGIGIPYRPEEDEFGIEEFGMRLSNELKKLSYEPKIFMECGRYITGPHGYLVSTVVNTKNTYKEYIGLDASMQNLMRPGMYGAYHYISALGKEGSPVIETYDVTGSLCENNDKFAVNRKLPKLEIGDIVVIHDAGAHGHAMGFNYNGKLRSAEFLFDSRGDFKLIRRAETPADYFATLDL